MSCNDDAHLDKDGKVQYTQSTKLPSFESNFTNLL